MTFTKEDYNYMANKRKVAFMEIAKRLGKDHTVTKMLGGLAWGRHNAEQGVDGNLQTAIREMAFLDGYYDCLNLWMRDHDPDTQYICNQIYPRRYETIRK